MYQGGEFEDPDGWTEEELEEFRKEFQKEVKKKKKGEDEITFEDMMSTNKKMKTPDPILVAQESGRHFRINLVSKVPDGEYIKTRYFKVDYRQQL